MSMLIDWASPQSSDDTVDTASPAMKIRFRPRRSEIDPQVRMTEAANAFLARLDQRTEDRDAPVSDETIGAQLTALAKWEQGTSPAGLTNVDKPVLVVNGDDDTMLPTISSFHLAQLLPDAKLSIYPNSGHGGIFQYHHLFVAQALAFLRD
jgi:pimeloyl-ACP methyl ester carboxylesterase